MSWITYTVLGAGGLAAIVFAFMAVRWRAQAAQTAAADAAAKTWQQHSSNLQIVVAEKERKLVEVEKAVLGNATGADLAGRLNELLKRPAAGNTPTKRAAGKAGTPPR